MVVTVISTILLLLPAYAASLPIPYGALGDSARGFEVSSSSRSESIVGSDGEFGLSSRALLASISAPSIAVPDIESLRKLAAAMDPELMQYAPKLGSFEEKYKNPCWRIDQAELRCIPYFFVGGSFQAGSSNLFAKLSMHPDVLTTDATKYQFFGEEGKKFMQYIQMQQKVVKEIEAAPDRKVLVDASSSTFAFYWSANLRAHQGFQRTIVPCFHNCSVSAKGDEMVKDDCMSTLCYPKAMANDRKVTDELGMDYELKHLPVLIQALYASNKVPKFIFLLRDPIERLHSAYWSHPHYKAKYGESAEGFLAYITEQINALKACSAPGRNHTERECALYFEALGAVEEKLFFHADQIIRGMYSIFAEVWLRHFPRENIMFIKSEDYFNDDVATLKKIHTFLGFSTASDRYWEQVSSRGKPESDTAGKSMLKEAQSMLLGLYKPYNTMLSQLLDDPDILMWNKKYESM